MGAVKGPDSCKERIECMVNQYQLTLLRLCYAYLRDEELAKEINRLMEGETSIPYCRELPVCDEDVERDALIPLERCEQCVLQWLHRPAVEE